MILLLVFVSILVSTNIFISRFQMQRQVDQILSICDTLEHWTGILQIEANDAQAKNAFTRTLINYADYVNADIIIVNTNGECIETTSAIKVVPDEYLEIVLRGRTFQKIDNFNGAYRKNVLTVGVPMKYQGTIIGGMFFNTGIPDLRRTTKDLFFTFFTASFFSIIVAFVLVYIQSKRISKPIREINLAAQAIASGNYNKHVAVTSSDEIGQLASSFNFMADSINKLDKQQSGFVSDVSHELRTPMTSITGFVSGILDGTIPEEKHEYYLNIVLDESRRLTKLINDLLEMSKMSSNEYHLSISEFDINEMIRILIIGSESKISEKNLDLNVDFSQDVLKVLADKDAIQRVLINLFDNAIKFSYPNTTIGINTWVENGRARICIGNFGEGIQGTDLSKIFNRFYKVDKSRTDNKSGAGLGLSFVKNILTLHKQSVWVESVDTKEGSNAKYTKFTFTLELA